MSVLENSLHHVSKKDELSFSIDIVMTEPVTFYQKLVMDLGLRPVSAGQVSNKKLVTDHSKTSIYRASRGNAK